MKVKHLNHVVLLLMFCGLLALKASAQTAQITGRVTDTAEAVVPGAAVNITNVDTGIARNSTTNEEGYYTVSLLPRGNYQVAINREGFKGLTKSGITLDEGQTQRLDFALEVGLVSENVEVTGTAPLLERDTTAVSTVIPNQKIVDLPLLNRNVITLAGLVPTVRPVGDFGGLPVSSFDGARVSIGGGPPSSNNLQIDGIAAENYTSGGLNVFLSVDATEEFRVISRNPSAEYGRTGGGVINIVSKSGTNNFHGTLYEFHRNKALNANEFFANRVGRKKGQFILNQYGGTLGGPIIKKKTFFFVNYEGFQLRQQQQSFRTVAADAQRRGDFRGTLDAQGRQVMIYDPATTRPGATPGSFVRDVINCNGVQNVICPERISPVAQAVLNFYPRSNVPGTITGANNFFGEVNVPQSKNIYGFKIDHNFTPERRLSGRYTYDKSFRGDPNFYGNEAETNTSALTFRRDSIALNFTDVLTPTLLLEAKVGLNRYAPTRNTRSLGYDLTQLGFPAQLNNILQFQQFPRTNISDISTIGADQGDQLIQGNNAYTAGANFSKTLASQSLKFGVEYRVYQNNNTQLAVPVLQFDFNRGFTQGPSPTATGTNVGYGVASFLLGAVGGGSASRSATTSYTVKNLGTYLQDDWKVTPKLTLNLGLRWEYESAVTDRFDALANFDPSAQNQINGVTFRGQLIYPGADGLSRGAFDDSYNNFQPRAGFAYQLFERTVVRGGYGIYFLPTTGNYVNLGRTGFDLTTALIATNAAVNGGFSPVANLRDPFPQGLLTPPVARAESEPVSEPASVPASAI